MVLGWKCVEFASPDVTLLGATFLNLVTNDLAKARAFYEGLGFPLNPEMSNDQAASFKINDSSFLHILTHDFMGQVTPHPITDTKSAVWGTFAIRAESRDELDAYAQKVLELGRGKEKAAQDLGFMYGQILRDLDGNIIEFFWMEPSEMPAS
jgi:predicted lactoylglutathione lyase